MLQETAKDCLQFTGYDQWTYSWPAMPLNHPDFRRTVPGFGSNSRVLWTHPMSQNSVFFPLTTNRGALHFSPADQRCWSFISPMDRAQWGIFFSNWQRKRQQYHLLLALYSKRCGTKLEQHEKTASSYFSAISPPTGGTWLLHHKESLPLNHCFIWFCRACNSQCKFLTSNAKIRIQHLYIHVSEHPPVFFQEA